MQQSQEAKLLTLNNSRNSSSSMFQLMASAPSNTIHTPSKQAQTQFRLRRTLENMSVTTLSSS